MMSCQHSKWWMFVVLIITTPSFAEEITYVDGDPDPFNGSTYAGAEDTMIITNLGGQQDQNFGQFPVLEAGVAFAAGDGRRHSLIRFDVSSLSGQYSRINSVTLRLSTVFVNGAGAVQAFQLADANADWIEGTGGPVGGGDPPDIGETTWDEKILGSMNWVGSAGASTAGVDYLSPIVGSGPFVATTATLDLVITDVSIVESWISGINAGLLLKTELEINGDRFGFNSSEATNAALRPQLIIDFTPAVVDLIEELSSDVSDINLANGLSNSLDSKLSNVTDAWVSENLDERGDVVNKLGAFINAVEAQRGNKITNADADFLIAKAEEIIDLLLEQL